MRYAIPVTHDDPLIEDGIVLCPQCGGEYTHVSYAEISNASNALSLQASGEDRGATITVGTSSFRDDGRRQSLRFLIDCENGHQTMIRLKQHKGFTYLTMERLPDALPDPPWHDESMDN